MNKEPDSILVYNQSVEQKLTESIETVFATNQQKIDRLLNSYGFQKLGDRPTEFILS